MVGKHNCQRRPKDIDVNFNVLVARTGKETGTHLGRDEPELCGIVATKAPTIEKQGFDYAMLKLMGELYAALLKTDVKLDPEARQRAVILNDVGKVYLKADLWKPLTSGKVVRITDDLDKLRREVAQLQKTVAQSKDRNVQKAIATLSKLTDAQLTGTMDELGEIYRGIGKGVHIPTCMIKDVVHEMSKQGVLPPEEASTLSKTLSSSKLETSTPVQLAQIVAPGVVTRQDGNVKARCKLLGMSKPPSEQPDAEEKKEANKDAVSPKPDEPKPRQEGGSSKKKKKSLPKEGAKLSRKSRPSNSKDDPAKRSLERVSNMLGMKSAKRPPEELAQDLQFQPTKTEEARNYQFLIVLNLLDEVESKNRPLTELELKFVRDVMENMATVPLDKVQVALNEASDKKVITPVQANKAFADLSKEAIKGTGNVPLIAVRKLFDEVMPKK
uniref:Uncharacterized protein n=1 Tax=Trichuris muris TaxID=70415 RepID=A0A5S6QI41_TRIMR